MTPFDAYSETFRVTDTEADVLRRMIPGAVLRRAQQVSTDHSDAVGMDAAFYASTHTAFLMAKMTLEFYAPIHIGDTITATTRPGAPVRATYFRTNEFRREDGTLACLMDSRWVLVDTDTHRILRRPPEALAPYFRLPPTHQLDLKVNKAPAEAVGQETATYTRCDSNRHMNNTYYADIVCDHVPVELIERRGVKRLAIQYHNEVPLGASFTLYRAQLGDGDWYFVGEGEKKHFEAQLTLNPEPA